LLFGDTNVRAAPEINLEQVIREKKAEVTQPTHAEDIANRV
jgi:hypothetical protein